MTFPLGVSANGRYWSTGTARRSGLVVMAMVHPGGYDTFPGLPPGHMATVPRNVHTGEGPLVVPGDFRALNEPDAKPNSSPAGPTQRERAGAANLVAWLMLRGC